MAVERDDFLKLLDTFRVAWEQLLSAGNVAHAATNTLDLEVELEKERRALSAKDELIRTLTQVRKMISMTPNQCAFHSYHLILVHFEFFKNL